jgi:hypothetical protein
VTLAAIAVAQPVQLKSRCSEGALWQASNAEEIANACLTKFLSHTATSPPALRLAYGSIKLATFFTLVVDDFADKYTDVHDANHLLTTLEKLYICKTGWSGTRYCGLTFKWNYVARACKMSMPGYIKRALQCFQHLQPSRPQPSPHAWQKPNCGAKTQYAPMPDTSAPLDAANTKHMHQEVLGTLLYYAPAIDSTMLVAISTFAPASPRNQRHHDRTHPFAELCSNQP